MTINFHAAIEEKNYPTHKLEVSVKSAVTSLYLDFQQLGEGSVTIFVNPGQLHRIQNAIQEYFDGKPVAVAAEKEPTQE